MTKANEERNQKSVKALEFKRQTVEQRRKEILDKQKSAEKQLKKQKDL